MYCFKESTLGMFKTWAWCSWETELPFAQSQIKQKCVGVVRQDFCTWRVDIVKLEKISKWLGNLGWQKDLVKSPKGVSHTWRIPPSIAEVLSTAICASEECLETKEAEIYCFLLCKTTLANIFGLQETLLLTHSHFLLQENSELFNLSILLLGIKIIIKNYLQDKLSSLFN